MKQPRSWKRVSPARLALFVEALVLLIIAKAAIWILPFRILARSFGKRQAESAAETSIQVEKIALEISWAVQAVARYSPIPMVCLPQAIAAKWMLRFRKIPSTLYLGWHPKPGPLKPEIGAHAWLRVGPKFITGASERLNFSVLASFAEEAITTEK